MANDDFDVEFFERRLLALKDSQDSIQSLSAWCLEKRQHHKKIVSTWLQVLKKVKVENRLTLFYLANDVIQYSKRKNFEFVESWGTTLQRATTMVRDEKVKHRILRIFKIWDQRQVYDEEFLADLSGLIQAAPKKKAEPQPVVPEEFQAALLISTMRSCATLEQATDARLRDLRESNVDVDNADELCASLKDRRHVEDAEKEVEIAVRSVENYVRALEAEIRERTQVLDLLEQADQFYETQRGEVKIVTNAYRNFGSRVKHLKKKLDELLPMLTSPIPSPDINAPSPSPDSDIDLPGEELQLSSQKSAIIEIAPPTMYGSYGQDYEPSSAGLNQSGDFTSNFSSFMDGNMDFDMRNIFSESSMTPTVNQHYNESMEAKKIEVINSSTREKNEDFSISSFLKTVLPSSEGTGDSSGIPGLGDVTDSSHVEYNISHIPGTPINTRLPGNHTGANDHHMLHSTPLPMRTLSGESHTPSPYSSQNSQSNIITFDGGNLNSANPLPPPPLPPPIFLDDENCYNKLPPKFPTWTPPNEIPKEPANWEEKGKNSMNPSWPGDEEKEKVLWEERGNDRWEMHGERTWTDNSRKNDIHLETPESPPLYEKAGFKDPIEYNDSQSQEPILSSASDVDHRVIPLPMTGNQLPQRLMKGDVDHRNLISLTGSPANHSTAIDSSPIPHNNLWPSTDQDYRQPVPQGDNVESVDMELSDDENEGKKGRGVLVDVRSQDRDMRGPPPIAAISHQMDMDMRMIPLPGGCAPQDLHKLRQAPPPPPPLPPQQFHHGPPDFHQAPPDFQQNNPMEFRPNQENFRSDGPPPFIPNRQNFHPNQQEFPPNQTNFPQNQPNFPPNQQNFPPNQPNFPPNQQNFPPNQQEFPPNQQDFPPNPHNFRQRDFHPAQDFDYRNNKHGWNHDDSMSHGRFSKHEQLHRDNSYRNERGGRGRGFRGNRRDRFSDEHNKRNNRRQKLFDHDPRSPPEMLPNNRPLLLETVDGGVIIDAVEFNENQGQDRQDFSFKNNRLHEESNPTENTSCVDENQLTAPNNNDKNSENAHMADTEVQKFNQESEESENIEAPENPKPKQQLSEQLQSLMNSETDSPQSLKRPSNFQNDEEATGSPLKKLMQMPNGPLLATPNGPPMDLPELHPVVVFDYEAQNAPPMFRPRMGTPNVQFPPWRGSPRGRPGFRGGPPRPPWPNNSPRGPPGNHFSPRKRGGGFRGGGGVVGGGGGGSGVGGGFRGRSRGRGRGNW